MRELVANSVYWPGGPIYLDTEKRVPHHLLDDITETRDVKGVSDGIWHTTWRYFVRDEIPYPHERLFTNTRRLEI